LRTELYRISGIDWAEINGIDVLTAQTVIAEAGADLSAFPSEKQFASWPGLCPTNEQSGGKILNRRTRKVSIGPAWRSATRPPCSAAKVIWERNTAVCATVSAHQKASRDGPQASLPVLQAPQARTAVRQQGIEYYEAGYREQQIRSLAKRAQKLGLQLVIPKIA
jgi:hypothetical protein